MDRHLWGGHRKGVRGRCRTIAKPQRKGKDLVWALMVTSYHSLVSSVWLTAFKPAWGHGEAGKHGCIRQTHTCRHEITPYWWRARPRLWQSLIKSCHHSNHYLIKKSLVVVSAHALSFFVSFVLPLCLQRFRIPHNYSQNGIFLQISLLHALINRATETTNLKVKMNEWPQLTYTCFSLWTGKKTKQKTLWNVLTKKKGYYVHLQLKTVLLCFMFPSKMGGGSWVNDTGWFGSGVLVATYSILGSHSIREREEIWPHGL